MLWETAGETGWRRWLGPIATVAATCLLLALSFALQYGLAAAATHQSDGGCALCTHLTLSCAGSNAPSEGDRAPVRR